MTESSRQTVFISHANPADNDAAGWLAAKLSALGYSVWIDVKKFRGGETIWRTIEPVLRVECRALILVLSKSTFGQDGQLRIGVEREMELGLTLERDYPKFVLPWIIDDLPLKDLPIQVHGRMSVPERRWSVALIRILDYLDSVGVRPGNNNEAETQVLQGLLLPDDIGVTHSTIRYDINRVECLKLPETLFSVADDCSISSELVSGLAYAGRRFSFHALKGSPRLFGQDMPIVHSLSDALSRGIEQYPLSPLETRRLVVELIRKSLHTQLRQRGLIELQRPKKASIFFFNRDTVPNGKVLIKLPENSKRSYRNVWGIHKNLYWHLGFEFSIGYADGFYVTLTPHILFTKDALLEPLDPDSIRDRRLQHKKRRSIAKLWFNDKWRGFYYTLLSFWKEEAGEIWFEFEGNSPLVLSGELSHLQVPVKHQRLKNLQPDDHVDDEEDDEEE
ncbi:MAG: toll/interleukin-1 receptor domain-containing protein [Armatimonadetes bacterium]|nr:toll/interleukin-1 receptor domain-containing protein [Armatimonadota bacterium]